MKFKTLLFAGLLPVGLSAPTWINAEELPEGTEINAANLDASLQATFEGHEIADIIPPSLQLLIRDFGLRMPLKPLEKYSPPADYSAATEKYSGEVVFDTATKKISNYVAGQPFPSVSVDDPDGGYKIAYNNFYSYGLYGPGAKGDYDLLLIDDELGLQHHQIWHFSASPMTGRIDLPHLLGKGVLAKKEVIVARAPNDIKGLGVLAYRYNDGRLNDSWAYIKAFRRVRRIPPSSWVDPLGGSDLLYDDINGFNAHPRWYKDFKYLGRRTILSMQLVRPQRVKEASTKEEEFPYIDLANWPHWNPLQQWGPAEVDVVEAIPPDNHRYGKKIYYFSVDIPGYALAFEAYDKEGELWKVDLLAPGAAEDEQGRLWMTRYLAHMIDIKKKHATVSVGWDVLPTHVDENALTPHGLKNLVR